jgi:3',5'-nucleoside bisphosphate phosphatase
MLKIDFMGFCGNNMHLFLKSVPDMICDLHCHTNFSSDSDIPYECMIRLAEQDGIEISSITDHNSIDSFNIFNKFTGSSSIKWIKGVEISCQSPFVSAEEIHILAYFPVFYDRHFTLSEVIADVLSVIEERTKRLSAAVGIEWASAWDWSEANRVFHPALSPACRNAYAFSLYVSKLPVQRRNIIKAQIRSAHLMAARERGWPPLPSPEKVIRVVRALGGVAGLAHPLRYQASIDDLRGFISSLADEGLGALEAFYAPDGEKSAVVSEIAETFGLDVTVGSDLHLMDAALMRRKRLQSLCVDADWTKVSKSGFIPALFGERL